MQKCAEGENCSNSFYNFNNYEKYHFFISEIIYYVCDIDIANIRDSR